MAARRIRNVWRRVRKNWTETWSVAVVFGLASILWTYAFVAELHLPLWPSFIASATFYAAGGDLQALKRGYASNVVGIVYATVTIGVVNTYFGGGDVALSVVVGVFMFLASLHEYVQVLSFTPGGFFGYATMFGVHAAGATAFGIGGLFGETLATMVAMLIGATVGMTTQQISQVFT